MLVMEFEYPRDCDLLWIASDAKGHLGAFLTAGQGPVPKHGVLRPEDLWKVEEEIGHLPRLGGHRLLASVPRPDDLIVLAEQGFFVYDWRDVHRSGADASHCYELVSIPDKPLLISDLDARIRDLAMSLEGADFGSDGAVDVCTMVECCTLGSG